MLSEQWVPEYPYVIAARPVRGRDVAAPRPVASHASSVSFQHAELEPSSTRHDQYVPSFLQLALSMGWAIDGQPIRRSYRRPRPRAMKHEDIHDIDDFMAELWEEERDRVRLSLYMFACH